MLSCSFRYEIRLPCIEIKLVGQGALCLAPWALHFDITATPLRRCSCNVHLANPVDYDTRDGCTRRCRSGCNAPDDNVSPRLISKQPVYKGQEITSLTKVKAHILGFYPTGKQRFNIPFHRSFTSFTLSRLHLQQVVCCSRCLLIFRQF